MSDEESRVGRPFRQLLATPYYIESEERRERDHSASSESNAYCMAYMLPSRCQYDVLGKYPV